MTNPQKVKGSAFERLAVEVLNELVDNGEFKRVPGSGAMGTSLNEPLLTADLNGKLDTFPRRFKIEAKVGYGGKTQFAIKKLWLDKVKEEARSNNSFPFLIGKFSGAREGVKIFVTMDVEEFAFLLNHITDLQKEIEYLNSEIDTADI